MKTMLKKTAILSLLAGATLVFSSFYKVKVPVFNHKWDNYQKVYQFLNKQVCNRFEDGLVLKTVKGKASLFSRCPSGYQPDFAIPTDSVRTDRYVNGKIEYYRGCTPYPVCDFKVCVDKQFVVVKSPGSTVWCSVSDWIVLQNRKTNKKAELLQKPASF